MYDKWRCIICQKDKDQELHRVLTPNMGQRIMYALENSSNPILNVIRKNFDESLDLQAKGTHYHRNCVTDENQGIDKLCDLEIGEVISNLEENQDD